MCDNDFDYLYIEIPKQRDIEWESEQFMELFTQYNEAIGGKSVMYEDMKKSINIVSKIRILEASQAFLNNLSESLKTTLKQLGVRLTGDMKRDILLIQGKIKYIIREYKDFSESSKNKETKTTLQNYIDILATISTHFKMHLDVKVITVASFCSYYSQFNRELESIMRMNRKNNRSGRRY